MANKPKSLYLTDRTMSALRGDEALSGRINQIVDRYLIMVRDDERSVRANLAGCWPVLMSSTPLAAPETLEQSRARLMGAVNSPAAASMLDSLCDTEVLVLLELLERDLAEGDPVPGKSEPSPGGGDPVSR